MPRVPRVPHGVQCPSGLRLSDGARGRHRRSRPSHGPRRAPAPAGPGTILAAASRGYRKLDGRARYYDGPRAGPPAPSPSLPHRVLISGSRGPAAPLKRRGG
eukprot:166875-Hanusia_phi.AAC.1